MLIALLLFDTALLSLVSVSAVAARRVGEAGRRNRAAIAAASRLDWLMSGPCTSSAAGAATLEAGVHEWWVSTPIGVGRELVDSVRVEGRRLERLVLRTRRLC